MPEAEPFIIAIAKPVSVRVPGELRADGEAAEVSYEDLTEESENLTMGLTFEGPTIV